jgi:hypothetical protein
MNARIQAAALKAGKGKDLSNEEFNKLFMEELAQQKTISGDALWAMRQEFAMPSNRASDAARSGTLRQVANEFDDEIRSQFGRDSDAARLFNEHIQAWRPNITNRKAVATAEEAGGAYTPKQARTAGSIVSVVGNLVIATSTSGCRPDMITNSPISQKICYCRKFSTLQAPNAMC